MRLLGIVTGLSWIVALVVAHFNEMPDACANIPTIEGFVVTNAFVWTGMFVCRAIVKGD